MECCLVILLLLLLKKVSSARLVESDIHPISPKTPAPQYQPIDRKKRKGKRVENYSRDRAAQANKEALALLLKPASPTPSKTEHQYKISCKERQNRSSMQSNRAQHAIEIAHSKVLCLGDYGTDCNFHYPQLRSVVCCLFSNKQPN